MNAKERFARNVRTEDGITAAWLSYCELAKRLNVDPVQLAEGDVLGKLYDACDAALDRLMARHRTENDVGNAAIVLTEALAACRQTGEGK